MINGSRASGINRTEPQIVIQPGKFHVSNFNEDLGHFLPQTKAFFPLVLVRVHEFYSHLGLQLSSSHMVLGASASFFAQAKTLDELLVGLYELQ